MNVTPPLALYFHWPFCLSKCAYCAFNSVASPPLPFVEEKQWVQALIVSFDWHVQHILQNRAPFYAIQSIFFGGGTPSLLHPESIYTLIKHVRTLWPFDLKATEITLEANPDTLTADRLISFFEAGINRLSLGVQALNNADLAHLGRTHSLERALQVISWISKVFANYNLDFIYKRPGQSLKMWETELEQICTFNSPHLSLYELTIEPGTPLADPMKKFSVKTERFLETTLRFMQKKGYSAYEISNFCRPHHACAHNLAYWHYQEYLGIGPGTHSRIGQRSERTAFTALSDLHKWRISVADTGGIATTTPLSSKERLIEHLLMGLRLEEGISWHQLEDNAGTSYVDTLCASSHFKMLQEKNILIVTQNGIKASHQGRLQIDAIVDYLNI
ncbi:MAG: radical SAM family heme chaperone HemW [Holosporales bacterium]|jgi:oxygen-independent coproporphyrinogen-3 oxidase|nr:radical SAM family heme chaperone HemW [Holosporales bacterium]